MSSQSPQRARKPTHPGVTIAAQAAVRREHSPSPLSRERERPRFNRSHSLSVSALTQIPQSHDSNIPDMSPERIQPQHSQSFSGTSLSSQQALQQPHQQQQAAQAPQQQPTVARPVPRVAPGHYINRLHDESEKWEMTSEIYADIDRADQLKQQQQSQHQVQPNVPQQMPPPIPQPSQPPAPGTEGVAYAGGARGEKEINGSNGTLGRKQSQRSSSRPLTPEARASPGYQQQPQVQIQTQVQVQIQGQNRAQAPTPPAIRRAANASPPTPVGMVNPASPARAMKTRTPDRSLPVQEEPEEDVAHEHEQRDREKSSRRESREQTQVQMQDLNSSRRERENDGRTSRNAHREEMDSDDATLLEQGGSDPQRSGSGQDGFRRQSDEDDEGSGTPRSPSASLLPEQAHQYQSIHETLNAMDSGTQQGKRSQDFDRNIIDQALKKLQPNGGAVAEHDRRPPVQQQSQQHPPPPPQPQAQQYRHRPPDSYQYSPTVGNNIPTLTQQEAEDVAAFSDEAAILQQYYRESPHPTYAQAYAYADELVRGGASPMPGGGMRPLVPPFSPAPPGGTPFPRPFHHYSRRNFAYPPRGGMPPALPSSTAASVVGAAAPGPSAYDLQSIQDQRAQQVLMWALNNGGGAMTDSTFSPASTPYPAARAYDPFTAFLARAHGLAGGPAHARSTQMDAGLAAASMRSSPSHEPITPAPPPPMPSRGRALKKKSVNLRQLGHQGRRVVNPPPRVESTQPRETSPEPSSGEETAGEKFGHAHGQEVYVPEPGNGVRWLPDSPGADDEGEWVDDEFDLEEDDLLDLEFHTSYVISGDKRKKRWEARWNEFMRAFQALDRQTDTTLVLLAAPSHTHNLYSLSSRSIRRDASLMHSPSMSTMKTAFEQLASARRSSRSHQVSLMDRLTYATSSAGDGSPSSTSSQREEELRRALAAALGSLTELGKLYENREQRWTEEMLKQSAERDSVEVLLRQTLGVGMQLQNSDMRNGL